MKLNPESIARASSRHPWRTVGIWAAILVAGMVAASTLLAPVLTTDFDFTNKPEAIRAQQLLEQKGLEQNVSPETFVLVGGQGAVQDPAFAEKVNAALGDLRALDPSIVLKVPAGYPLSQEDAANPQVAALGPIPSQDGTAVLFSVILTNNSDQTATIVDDLEAIRERYSQGGTTMYQLGEPTSTADFKKISEEDFKKGDAIGILVAIIVLLIVFGSLLAGITPIVMGLFAIVTAIGLVALVGQIWHFSFFVTNVISMMGLAVGIDYSLFIVSRFREERARGQEKLDAIGRAGATANRAVFFSGITVILALAGMLLMPATIFRALSGGAIFVVLVSVALSMTFLPALMSLFGDHLVKPGAVFGRGRTLEHGRAGGFWDRMSRSVMKHSWAWLIGTATFLVVLSLPYWVQGHPEDNGRGMKTGFSGISTIPDGIQTKDAYNALVAKFPQAGGQVSTDVVIPTTDASQQQVTTLIGIVGSDPVFGTPVTQTSQDGSLTLVRFPMTGAAADSSSEAAVEAVTRMRDQYVPQAFGADSGVLVGGSPPGQNTAVVKDFFDISDFYRPIIIGLILLLSFILLTVVFRSIVVSAKAIVMNLLSVGAAYGLITLIFQRGGPAFGKAIADAVGWKQVDAIESWLPLFLFSILFGLSMDYQVFLLTRIREEYDKTQDNTEAVAYGLRTTGGIITGAAVIMVAVFAGFAAGRLVSFQEMGFGLAVAVLLDATIVRSVLVPSAMKLLGDRNWYLPKFLRWLPAIDVEGHQQTVEVPELVEAGERTDG
jgi:RND superfamily putative drug exporter